MAQLHVRELHAGYRSRPVLTGLSLPPIEAGQIVALVGPNGAGKTTLLRALAGLVPATGNVRLGEASLLEMTATERARIVAFMPQFVPQRLSLTVIEAVITALRAAPTLAVSSTEDAQRRAIAMLDRLGILDLALEPFDRLSGGQRQLASLAQALVREPALLLLDEPTSALDLRHQADVIKNIRSIAETGTIVIMVLHDLQAVAAWADSAIVIRNGMRYADGPPQSVITAAMLRDVYDVAANVETTASGGLHIHVG
jgi:iron complex transport system ATP-binding protein